MDLLRTLLSRILAMFRAGTLDASLDEELRAHLDMAVADHVSRGMSEAEARYLALREFGGITQVTEQYRVQRGLPLLEQIARDVRFGIYQLWRSPGFMLTAILTLALAVGANTTVFSMINGLLLRPLPTPDAGRLAVLGITFGDPRPSFSFPEPLFRGLERQRGAFSSIFGFNRADFQVKSGASTEIVYGQYVSGTFFEVLQTPPLLGRLLTMRDDSKGGDPSGFAAVISEALWENRFHRDPTIIGRQLIVDNVVFSIVGVMPRSFFGADPLERPQIFIPLADEEVLNGEHSMVKAAHHGWWINVMGRLAPRATLEQANAQVSAVTSAILHETVTDAEWIARYEERHLSFLAQSGSTGFTYIRLNYRKPLVAIFAMCGGILLLACLNLASLLMARGTARQRELATRMALGASRRRLVQQLVVESLVLGTLGTAIGLAIAPAVSRLLGAILLSGRSDAYLDSSIDVRVLGFAGATAMLATLLFGLAPAVKATSRSLIARIKDGQRATSSRERRAMLPRILLAAEVGLALILVVGTGLVVTSLLRLYSSGEGFDPQGIQNIAFRMDKAGLKGEALTSFYREMAGRLSHQPGVTGVSYARMIPFTGSQWDEDFDDTLGRSHNISMNSVAPSYFSTMRIPLVAGRDFTWNDTRTAGLKIIVNQAAAGQLFPDSNAIGSSLRLKQGKKISIFEVVGVVADAKYSDLRSAAPATAYVAVPQDDDEQGESFTAVVRTSLPPSPLAADVRNLTTQMAPSVPAPEMTSMLRIIDNSLSAERMMTLLSIFFAVCALGVTAIGLYGTLAYATARRTAEIGVRMALGAQRSQVLTMVFGQNLRVVVAGTIVGLGIALFATRALADFLFLTSARDPWVIAAAIFALAFTACVASLLPALRAARIEPMSAIRCE